MAQTASAVTQIFTGYRDAGVNVAVATAALDSGITLAPIPAAYVVAQNMAIEVYERASVV